MITFPSKADYVVKPKSSFTYTLPICQRKTINTCYTISGTITADIYNHAFYHNILCKDITLSKYLITYTTPPSAPYTEFIQATETELNSVVDLSTLLADQNSEVSGTYLSAGCNYSFTVATDNNVYSPYGVPLIEIYPTYNYSSTNGHWYFLNQLYSTLNKVPQNFDFIMHYDLDSGSIPPR